MVEKKRQNLRYSDSEMQIIKDVFADNTELLYAIRKVFLQLPLTAVEQSLLILIQKPEILKVIRKAYLPEIEADAPFHQVIDLWMTVDIKGKEPKEAYTELVVREKVIAYVEQQLRVLENLESPQPIVLNDCIQMRPKTKAEEMYIDIMTRNYVVAHNEMQLAMFEVLAGQKSESVDDTKKRLAQNSTK
jgi:hypothetical protein